MTWLTSRSSARSSGGDARRFDANIWRLEYAKCAEDSYGERAGFCAGAAYTFLFVVYLRGNHPAALLTGGAFALAAVGVLVEAAMKRWRAKRADAEKRGE